MVSLPTVKKWYREEFRKQGIPLKGLDIPKEFFELERISLSSAYMSREEFSDYCKDFIKIFSAEHETDSFAIEKEYGFQRNDGREVNIFAYDLILKGLKSDSNAKFEEVGEKNLKDMLEVKFGFRDQFDPVNEIDSIENSIMEEVEKYDSKMVDFRKFTEAPAGIHLHFFTGNFQKRRAMYNQIRTMLPELVIISSELEEEDKRSYRLDNYFREVIPSIESGGDLNLRGVKHSSKGYEQLLLSKHGSLELRYIDALPSIRDQAATINFHLALLKKMSLNYNNKILFPTDKLEYSLQSAYSDALTVIPTEEYWKKYGERKRLLVPYLQSILNSGTLKEEENSIIGGKLSLN